MEGQDPGQNDGAATDRLAEAERRVRELERELDEARRRLAAERGAGPEETSVDRPAGGAGGGFSGEDALRFLAALPVVTWVKDAAGVHRYANPKLLERFGFAGRAGDVIGHPDSALGMAPDELKRVRGHDREVMQSNAAFQGVERVTAADGVSRAWLVVKFPFAAGSPEERVAGGFAVEVTAAMSRQEQLELALEAADGGTWTWEADPEGGKGYIDFSERCWAIRGKKPPPEASHPSEVQDEMHPDDLPGFESHLAAVLDNREPRLDRTVRLRHADGHWHWIRTVGEAVRRDADGKPLRMAGLHLDVHAAKTAERELAARARRLEGQLEEEGELRRESESRFMDLARRSPLMLWMSGIDAKTVWLNPELERFFGSGRSGIQGRRTLHRCILRLDRDRRGGDPAAGAGASEASAASRAPAAPAAPDAPSARASFEHEVQLTDATGATRWMLLYCRPRLTRDGRLIGHVGTAVDATDRHETRAALERSKLELEHQVAERTAELEDRLEELAGRNRELDQFAHVASHDLRSPLRTIIGFVGLLGPAVAHDEEARQHLERIQRAGGRMADLLDSLLAFASVGRGVLRTSAVDLDAVLVEVLEDLAAEITRLGADVRVEPLPQVIGDETMLRQAFQNLVHNAIKYAGDAPPTVRVRPEPGAPAGSVRIVVADRGVGFPPEAAERLFEPFSRFHPQSSPGSGVGLSIVRRVLSRHGSRVWAERDEGDEMPTRFLVELPAARRRGGSSR
ncbi:PAS domain-containing sensor histidine kinase [Phycisphaera mikurensis]|uniref:histidine kinase n=1 Tax=Phycisphaera mikurensis (strain NBRC 102666 / KCTC 22515 / FYK2301M01) TaxID=1142394 RepID=I0IG85_PHYMF|nr:ATP-binding protein [Phycisphaera mikurensis]MBB6440345.1 signal transduction histidine kinase [Phycisphaera mikurensis]BAM04273.1 putative two-component system sensor histidine kinase [Phycisphaera mikurensis NBRC 102666]